MTSKVGENAGIKGWPWKTWEDFFNQKMKEPSNNLDRIKILDQAYLG